VTGDVGGDRDADLVHPGGYLTASYVGVAYNLGDGTLKTPMRESHVGIPRQVAIADLDGDGLGDLVGVHYTGPITSGASVFLSEGGGEFGPASLNLTTPGDFPRSVAVTDLDDDGALDLLMGLESGGDLVAMLGAGDGTFGAPLSTSTADIPFDVAVDFLDGDVFPDVVVTHTSTGEAQSWLGDGDGTFTLADTESLAGTVEWARIADLDDNGDADIVVSVGNGDLALLTGAGDGTFIRPTTLDGAPGNQMNGVVVDFFDADSLPDIAVFTDGAAWVHLGVGAGLFAPRVSYQHRGIDAGTPTSTDLDGDGAVDLVFSRGNELHLMLGAGDGTFGAPLTFQLTHWVLFPDAKPPAFGDVDGDGTLDVALSDGSSVDGGISVLLNRTGPAADLGFGLGGAHGVPVLESTGTFVSGASVSFVLTNAIESGLAHLVLGALRVDAPFKFGVLVPFPHFIIFNLPTDGNGELVIPMTWPTGLPPDVATYWQYWLPDPAGIVGFAASTALEITTP